MTTYEVTVPFLHFVRVEVPEGTPRARAAEIAADGGGDLICEERDARWDVGRYEVVEAEEQDDAPPCPQADPACPGYSHMDCRRQIEDVDDVDEGDEDEDCPYDDPHCDAPAGGFHHACERPPEDEYEGSDEG